MTYGREHFRRALLVTAACAGLHVPALAQVPSTTVADTSSGLASIGDIVVTAKTGSQRVRAISDSETALTGRALETVGAEGLQDYLTRTPGVVFNAAVPGASSVTIRGVGTTTGLDQGQSPTGFYVNDIPLTDPYYNVGTPDIDSFDVGDVSIYRGPQSTLFGASSLGGAINYRTTPPNLDAFELHVQGEGEGLDHSGATGGAGKIMLNAPVARDKLAARVVYSYRRDAGFIDNRGLGRRDSNRTVVDGGRALVTWKPGDGTSLNYLFLQQSQNTRDLGYSSPATQGRYAKSTLFPEAFNFKIRLNSLRLDQSVGTATATLMGTYHEKFSDTASDLTPYLASIVGPFGGPYEDGGPSSSKGKTVEGRLASDPNDKFAFLLGVYHDNTRERLNENLAGRNPAGVVAFVNAVYGPLLGNPMLGTAIASDGVVFRSNIRTRGRETAVFGEATYHLGDTFKLNFGGRYFRTSLGIDSTSSGLVQALTVGALSTSISGKQKEHGFTPKGSITWTPSSEFMAYALISKGFRFGGPNVTPPDPTFATPRTFKSDSLVNYEVGIRTDWLDHKLSFDATAFYIDWSDIQLRLSTPLGFLYAANAGKAVNYGVELVTALVPTTGIRLENSLSYLSAQLDQDFAPGGGQPVVRKDTRLPGASKWRVSTTATIALPEVFGLSSDLVASQRYTSSAPGIFGQNVRQGGYSLYDARLAVHLTDGLDVTGYVENIGDSRGVTSASRTPIAGFRQYLVRPRTFGLRVDYRL